MARMLADGKDKLLWVPEGGIANLAAPTVTELTAAGVIDISCAVSKANFSLGPTGTADITDTPLCSEAEVVSPGIIQYGGEMDFYRYTTTLEDIAWTTFTDRGIPGFLVHRASDKDSADAIAATDEVGVYEALTGIQVPQAPDGGYRKFRQRFYIQRGEPRAVVAAGV